MAPRTDLHILLQSLGAAAVYFQPPPTVKMVYPCIVYKRSNGYTKFADNKPYRYEKRYEVTVIASDPDDPTSDKVAALPLCKYDRHFTSNNLNHDVFSLFY